MEPKKSKKADLEGKKSIFFQVGVLVALLIVFLAFEYVGAKERSVETYDPIEIIPEVDIFIDVTPIKELPPPPATGPIEVVPDGTDVDDAPVFNPEDDPTQENPDYGELAPVAPTPEIIRDDVVDFPDIEPEFQGGEEARMRFLNDNVKYPDYAIKMQIDGRVVVSFVVEPDGSISNVKILRSVADCLDNEALRVAKLMPKWRPGMQKGKAVRARYMMPITFTLE
jgi:protein TonB